MSEISNKIEWCLKKAEKEIWAGVLANNKASVRVLEKARFKRERHLRKATFKRVKFYDDYIYARVR